MGIKALENPMAAGQGPLDLVAVRPVLADFLAADERVQIAYLFGSQAQGRAGERSDMDVAIRVSGSPSLEECDALRTEWEEALSELLGRNDVDVVVLNGADLFLRYQVIKQGQVLFEREPGLALENWRRTFKEYVDVKPLWDRFTRLIRQSIQEGKPGGRYRGHRTLAGKAGRLSQRSPRV
jgi:predicted nucleotidyltransferase